MEGRLAEECYEKAKDEGCVVEVVWQDGDSSSSLSVEKHFGNGKVYVQVWRARWQGTWE